MSHFIIFFLHNCNIFAKRYATRRMKITYLHKQDWRGLFGFSSVRAICVLTVLAGILLAKTAQGQIYVSSWNADTVGEYTTSGATVNAALVSGLNRPYGVALDGNGNLFVANQPSGTIGEYTTSGAVVNAALVSGLNTPLGLVSDGNGHLFVANEGNNTIGEYTTSGATVNAALITGLDYPFSLALDGAGHLFVANDGNGMVGEYTTSGATVNASLISVGFGGLWGIAADENNVFVSCLALGLSGGSIGKYTTSGAVVNAALVSGLNCPLGLALDGNGDLFVASANSSSVGEYTTSGAVVNAALLSGLDHPTFMAVVPEPSSAVLAVLGSALLTFRRMIRRVRV